MRITVLTDVGVDELLPPRCSKVRPGTIRFPVTCDLVEIAAVELAARTTARECGETVERDYYFEPSVGFLIRCEMTADQLAKSMSSLPYGHAVSAEKVPGQGNREIIRHRREIEVRASEYVVSDKGTVYNKVYEPCYMIRYTPSFNWCGCDLTVQEAPAFTEHEYRLSRGWCRLYAAQHWIEARRHCELLKLANRQERVTGRDDERIEVFLPEAFTFDAARWHAERETSLVLEKLTDLVGGLRGGPELEEAALSPERRILAEILADAMAILYEGNTLYRLQARAERQLDEWMQSVEDSPTTE